MAFDRGPYLSVATFCENVIEDKGGSLSLIRIVDRFQMEAQGTVVPEEMPPTMLNWFLVICMKAGEARGTHAIKVEPELPSGIRIQPLILSAYFEGGNRGTNLVTKLGFQLKMPGIYWFRIYIDDMFITQIPLEVIYTKIITPGLPPPPQQP